MFADTYGPWAVIAGGSDGIGAAFASELAARGLNLLLIARNPQTLATLRAEIAAAHPHADIRTLALDLSRDDAAETVTTATAALDIGCLIYNVGSEPNYGDFLGHSWAFVHGRMNRNFVTKAALTHHFGRRMRKRGRGSIILMGSMSGYFGSPGFALYSASKAFTRYLAEGLWFEMKQANVDLLCPVVGPTDTPTMRKAYGILEHAMNPDDVARSALDALGSGPIWIARDIAAQLAPMEAMPPAARSTLAAKWAEDFVLHGKKPGAPA
jgi:short-subunit dehydrogenase